MANHQHFHRRHAQPQWDPFAAAASALGFDSPDDSQVTAAQPAPSTVVSYVYVTAPKTFAGPVGGYTTMGPVVAASSSTPEPTPTPTPKVSSTPKVKSSSPVESSTPVETPTLSTSQQTTFQTSASLPDSIVPPSTSIASTAGLLAASSVISSSQTPTSPSTNAGVSAVATSSPSSGGMSAGGKAGLAIGLILLFGTVIALVVFFIKKRRDAEHERLDDEKMDIVREAGAAGVGRSASTRTTATAPRLSLRPVTQFIPNFGDNRQSRGNALATPEKTGLAPVEPGRSLWDRPIAGQEANKNNPFGNHAETIDAANANGPPIVNSVGPGGEIIAGAGLAAGAAVGLARGASKRENGQKPMDFTTKGPILPPPSPSGTEFSVNSQSTNSPPAPTGTGAAIAAAGGPANSTVHRVQLDFKPSMDDELELKAGQLIRLLHEYDDGWALCIRLDRSRQGVVPRTCLSVRPVKPRPVQNGPRGAGPQGTPPPGMRVPNQQGRGMSPAMNQQGRPMSPAMNQQGRPMSPAMNQQGRPMSPASNRPMTPNSQGRSRSPSVAQLQDRRNSPPGPSRMNPTPTIQVDGANSSPPLSKSPPSGLVGRKPVPGQAL